MKRVFLILICGIIIFSLTACESMAVSNKKYSEISNYVLENMDTFSPEKEIEFFEYKTTGLIIGGVYYGYYYTKSNIIAVPDFYCGDNLGEKFEADGGTFFGKPNNGTDWCYIKRITETWYYYELHWA